MRDEPRNAASEVVRALRDLLLDRDRVDEWAAAFADGFVLQDRRKSIGFTELDKAAYIEGLVSLSNELVFAPDDLDAAATELDRLHTETGD